MRHRRLVAVGAAAAVLSLTLAATVALALQTFPDPFGGDGLFVDIGSGAQDADVGDAFFLRDGDTLRIRMFLDAPNVFIESHVCLSAEPFTGRIPPGQCQFLELGAGAGSYDIALPPALFPSGTVPFSDPLGPFCVQVHVRYDRPGLARTELGGGSAFAGWQPGSPFFGNVCFPEAPEPPPTGGTAEVAKTGVLVGDDLTFTVTVTNPTSEIAPDVVIVDELPAGPTWTLPPECAFAPSEPIARCELGDLAGGATVDLEFMATLAADECGTFVNIVVSFVGDDADATSADTAAVDVPCPPDPPPDPLILMTKEPSAATVTAPGTITFIVTFENAGPDAATNVTVTDELPAGVQWSLGSGSNVCNITGTTLTCFAETVPDGVFEVLEIFGELDGTFCGTLNNQVTVEFEGGPEPGSVTAVSPPVEVTGCPTPTPTPTDDGGEGGAGGGAGGDGDLPDTAAAIPPPAWPVEVLTVVAIASASVLGLRLRSRPRRTSVAGED